MTRLRGGRVHGVWTPPRTLLVTREVRPAIPPTMLPPGMRATSCSVPSGIHNPTLAEVVGALKGERWNTPTAFRPAANLSGMQSSPFDSGIPCERLRVGGRWVHARGCTVTT